MIENLEMKATKSGEMRDRKSSGPLLRLSKHKKHEVAFCKGVADGFGSVGHIFLSGGSTRSKRKDRYKRYVEILEKYKANAALDELALTDLHERYRRRMDEQLSGQHLDMLKIKGDYCKVLAKLTEEAGIMTQQAQEQQRRCLAEMAAQFKCTARAKVTNDR